MSMPGAFADVVVAPPIDVVGNLPVAQFTGFNFGGRSYKDWGNEPSITVNPLNTNQIVVSSFAFGTSSTTSGASFFYSTNGGASWSTQLTVPAPASGVGIPNDWRFAYDSSGVLHAAVLGGCNSCNVYAGSTTDPTSLAAWTWSGGGAKINASISNNNADQPWLAVAGSNVYVGYDDFHSGTNERIVASSNGGTTFTVGSQMTNGAQTNFVNPGTRIATDGVGNVYAVFGVGDSTAAHGAGIHSVTYYLNRSHDGGATWDFNGSSVIGGINYGSGLSTQLDNAGTQSSNTWFAGVNDLRGNETAIAADANGKHVYAMYGARDGGGIDRLYLVEFHPVGGNLVASAPLLMSVAGERAGLPTLTVLDDGTVMVMYDSFNSSTGKVNIHLASTHDHGATLSSDQVAYSFTPLTLLQATGSTTSNREFGDYQFITSQGNTFYAAFAGLGNVNGGGINTTGLIDPFFLTGYDSVPEPGTITMMLGALGGALCAVRVRRSRQA